MSSGAPADVPLFAVARNDASAPDYLTAASQRDSPLRVPDLRRHWPVLVLDEIKSVRRARPSPATLALAATWGCCPVASSSRPAPPRCFVWRVSAPRSRAPLARLWARSFL